MTWKGIDVSNNNGVINWPQVAASGVSWAGIKVSEGTGYVDPIAATNLAGAQAAGLTVVPYHFARPDLGTKAVDEATFFLAHCGSSPLVVLDMEMPETPGPDLSAWALAFLNHVQDAGKAVYIYSYPSYIQTRLQDPSLTAYLTAFGLWLASYSASFIVPSPWSSIVMWQNADNGVVPGVPGQVDTDISYVDLSTVKPTLPPPPHSVLISPQWLKTQPSTESAAVPNAHVPANQTIALEGSPVTNKEGEWTKVGWGHQGVFYQGWVQTRFIKTA